MKINYKEIDAAVARMNEARHDFYKIANLRVGVISGGPSIEDERLELNEAHNKLLAFVKIAIDSGCRGKTLLEHLNGEFSSTKEAKRLLDERGFRLIRNC